MSENGHSFAYVVQPGDSLSKILKRLHGPTISSCDAKLLELMAIALNNNPQIKDPNSLFPGQCIDISGFRKPPMNINRWRFESVVAGNEWAKLPSDKQRLVEEQPDMLGFMLKLTGAGVGMASAYEDAVARHLEYISSLITEKSEMVTALAQARKLGVKGSFGTQLAEQATLSRTEQTLKGALDELTVLMRKAITETPKNSTGLFGSSLNRVQKFLFRLPSGLGEDANVFSTYLSRVSKLGTQAGRFAKGGAYVVPILIGGYEIRKDWNTPNRTRTTAKVTASVSAGIAGGYTGYAICTALFFGGSGGTSPLWCGLLASGLTGIISSEFAERGVQQVFDQFTSPYTLIESEQCRLPGR